MSKIVKVALVVVAAVAIVAFAPAIAGFLAAAGAAVGVGAGVASAALISAVVGVGLSLGFSAVGMLFRKSADLNQSMVDRLNKTELATAPRKFVFGRTAAGNDIRFHETTGKNKDIYHEVVALASHRVHAIKQWWIEDTLTWSNGSLIRHQDGIRSVRVVTEGKPGNGAPVGSGAYWNASSTFTGCAYMAVSYNLGKPWPQGLPSKMVTIVEGCPLYDPRQDSTRGGSGAHRVNDQATWSWVGPNGVEIGRNPALCLLAYLIGWRINGELAWGMGIPIEAINLDNFRAFANVCEERVQVAAGGTTQRYTCDAIFSTNDAHEAVINAITAGMGSTKLTDVGGYYCLIGGFDDTFGPKVAFDEGDLVGGVGAPAPYAWSPAGSPSGTYNIVRGRFANPDELFQLAEWGEIVTDALPDGIPRTLTLDLGYVDRAETCQRIAKQFVAREALTPGHFVGNFGFKAALVQVGDLCTLSLPSQQGWNGKLFRVVEQTETPNMLYQMKLREESPAVYQWDYNEAIPLPPSIRPPGYDASMVPAVEGLTLSSTTYQGV